MKVNALILLTFFNSLYAYCQDSIFVTVNTSDCSYCYNYFTNIDKLSEKYKIILLFRNSEFSVSDEFIKGTLKLQKEYPRKYSDSLFDSFSISATSGMTIFSKGKPTYQMTVKSFSKYQFILEKKTVRNDLTPLNLSDILNANGSKGFILNNGRETFQMIDPVHSVIYFFNKRPLSFSKKITCEDIISDNLVKTAIDTIKGISDYDKYETMLASVNVSRLKISPTHTMESESGWINQVVFTAPYFDSLKQSIVVGGKPVFIIFDGDSIKKVLTLNSENDSLTYPGLCYYLSGDTVIGSRLGKEDASSDLYLAQYKIVNKTIRFMKYYNARIPEEYRKYGLNYKLLNPKLRYPYIFNSFTREVFNVEIDKVIFLPFMENKINIHGGRIDFDYLIKDVTYNEGINAWKLLIQKKSDIYVYTLNKNLTEILFIQLLVDPNNEAFISKSQNLMFLDSNNVIYLNSENRQLILHPYL